MLNLLDQFRPFYKHQKAFNAWFMKNIMNKMGRNLI